MVTPPKNLDIDLGAVKNQVYSTAFKRFTKEVTTVNGRNPAPTGMYKTLVNNGINYLSTG